MDELPTRRWPPLRVLVVDPHPPVPQMLGRVFERIGFDVHAVASGDDAAALLDLRPDLRFDLLLTYVFVGEMGVMDLADVFVRRHPEARRVVYSAYEDPNEHRWLRERYHAVLCQPSAASHVLRLLDPWFPA